MQHDASELSPGRKDFWDAFYDAEDGRLTQKEASNRRASELQERGSLLDHYEWFMEFPLYEAQLVAALRQHLRLPSDSVASAGDSVHVLHIGCGNSDFADHVADVFANAYATRRSAASPPEVLNIDVCENILAHLSTLFPERLYAVGSCCSLVCEDGTEKVPDTEGSHSRWFSTRQHPSSETCAQLQTIWPGTVDLVFDKGTVDALLSAFAGEYNENVAAYAEQSLKVLRPGGMLFVVSINSADTLDSYFLGAATADRYFQVCYDDVIHLNKRGSVNLRVETLGSRYNCRAYTAVAD